MIPFRGVASLALGTIAKRCSLLSGSRPMGTLKDGTRWGRMDAVGDVSGDG